MDIWLNESNNNKQTPAPIQTEKSAQTCNAMN